MVHFYSIEPWEQDDFDTTYHHRQQTKPRFQASTRSTKPRQSTFKRQDRSTFQPESYTPYYMDKEEDNDTYQPPYIYSDSPEDITDDLMLDNDYDMDSAISWTRRPRRTRSLAIPNIEANDHYPHHQQNIRRDPLSPRRQRRSSYVSPKPVDSNRYYMEPDYIYDQDDIPYARSDLSHIKRRNSLQHYRHDSSHWVKPPVMGSTFSQHRMDTPSSSFYSHPPPILTMPQPPMITLPSLLPPPPPPLGFPTFPGVLPPFHPMMMMPQPTMPPLSPPSDKAKNPSDAPDDNADNSSIKGGGDNGLVPLARSLSLSTSQPTRRSLFGNLFHTELKSSDHPSPTLIPVQDLSTRSLSRKQSMSLEKKAKALSQRSYIWCYRIKPSVLIMQPSNCWFAMTPKNQIKLDPYLCFYQPNTVAKADHLPTLVTLDKEPKLTGSVTAMPQAKIARVYPSIFSSSNYIELVLDCLPADSQFVVRSD